LEREHEPSTVRFDDSLSILVDVVHRELGNRVLRNGIALRDVNGKLAFISKGKLNATKRDRAEAQLRKALLNYARSDRVLADIGDFGTAPLLEEKGYLHVRVSGHVVSLLDRRLVGGDWLRSPAPVAPPPSRFVFASLKGGVGRSTALSVAAADLARQGRRVLAVDLDMEAPGLGSILLDDETLPEFGIVDALVENNISRLDQAFFADLVGPSGLADRNGKIDVIPAFGKRSRKNPGDVLAKIARAYTEDIDEDGNVSTVLDQINSIIANYSQPNRYDVILLDARSGLNETTASAVLGLGAEILFFGLNDAQTFHGYAALFAHLARFLEDDQSLPEWIGRLTMVQAKASADPSDREEFSERSKSLFLDSGLARPMNREEPFNRKESVSSFREIVWREDNDDIDLDFVESQPSVPIAILEDEHFRRFRPLINNDVLLHSVYMSSYGSLLERIREAVNNSVDSI
jgi:MinD-like ATPase involved in chromosome partitioning or flagellar assembly